MVLLKRHESCSIKAGGLQNDRIDVRNDGARLDQPIHEAQIDEFFVVYGKWSIYSMGTPGPIALRLTCDEIPGPGPRPAL